MNTKIVMIASATVMGLIGIILSFLPQETAGYLGWPVAHAIVLQLLGALYFSFAMINWTGKANLVGGIYGKPIALGNFTHFAIGALALLKGVMHSTPTPVWGLVTGIYLIFALIFGYILFTHPKLKIRENTATSRP